MENWKCIEGFQGYKISDLGRVMNKAGYVLKPVVNKFGYYQVNLYKDGKHHTKRVHKLVVGAFLPNTDNKPQVNHIDGVKTNNCLTNLEWVTASENREHAYKLGLISNTAERDRKAGEGARRNLGKKIALTHKNGTILEFDSVRQACSELNLDRSSLSRVLNGVKSNKTIKGYTAVYR